MNIKCRLEHKVSRNYKRKRGFLVNNYKNFGNSVLDQFNLNQDLKKRNVSAVMIIFNVLMCGTTLRGALFIQHDN